jgi:dienelactone hydrolase
MGWVGGLLSGLTLGTTLLGGEPVYQAQHAGNQLNGIEVLEATNGTFRLRADAPTRGRLVIKGDAPVELVSSEGAKFELRIGWDGTLEYAHYGLDVVFPAAGEATVVVRAIPHPDKPVIETEADFAAFKKKYDARPSRFPDEGFPAWQKQYKTKLSALLMGGGLPQRVPLEVKILETKEYPKFTLRRIEYRSQSDRVNVALLSLPKGVEKAPLLLALHGHENDWGDASEKAYTPGNADDFCAFFAERGWAVLQPATMNHKLQHPTWTLQGEWSWDAIVAIDYAATLPEVDMSRVAVCGLSTGAHLAMNVMALDDRIRAGVIGCIFSTWNHYQRRFRVPPHCECGIMSQIADRIEQCDWAALAAPKPVQFHHGRKDPSMCPGADPNDLIPGNQWIKTGLCANTGTMPQAEYDTALGEVRRAYRLAGSTDEMVSSVIHDGPHSVNNESAFDWLTKALPTP